MKRFITITILVLLPVLFLSGCLNPSVVTVVERAYEAALMENDALLETFFSEEYLAEHPLDELSIEMAEDVRNRQGTKLMNMKEHRGHLNPEIVKLLDDEYAGEWNFVAVQTDDETIMTWIVQKGESKYSIVDGKKMNADVYLEEVLK
ncbi:hypothetical protein [Oceanobacillus damuensis]|uniref:hypothetical protein n=1 Tax=Oceanobacillus damuensis TaxID=937928 RepID=UPI0008366819|nr:hypothetical protein [Oceanobacillus damuensis]